MRANGRRENARRKSYKSMAAGEELNIEVADFLAQSIAVKSEQVGGTDLIAARGGQGGRQQWVFDFAQNAVIEPGRRQPVFKPREIRGEMPFNGSAKAFVAFRFVAAYGESRLRQLRLDNSDRNRLLGVERRQPASQILELANIPWPAMPLEAIDCGLIDLLRRKAFALDLREEMTDQIWNIFDALAQRRQSQGHHIEPEE